MTEATTTSFSARADWLFPVDSEPVRGGVLNVHQGRIVSAGQVQPEYPLQDWGSVAVTPGWVNAHTHLEFSDLLDPLGDPEESFPDWIRQVIRWRVGRDEDPAAGARSKLEAIELGLQESLCGGATYLGEIATSPWPADPFYASKLRGVLFLELIGLSEDRHDQLRALAGGHQPLANGKWRAGISPHAPYTISPPMVEEVCRQHGRPGGIVAMHLAETFDELELLSSASGDLRTLLDELGAWDGSAVARGVGVMDYLERLSLANRSLVIHGNYLVSDEISFLAEHSPSMSVVYCPRTHAHFRHGAYPLEELWQAGVNVAVGTDSRASNPDLKMIEELRFLVEKLSLSPRRVLEMATRCGAVAMGMSSEIGGLSPGKRADLTVLRLPMDEPEDPHERLFAAGGEVERVFIGGQLAYEAPAFP